MWPRVLAGCLVSLVLALLTPTHSTARGAAADPPASFAPAVQAVQRAVLSVVVRPSLDEIDTDLDDLDAARVLAEIFAGDVPRRTLGAAVVLDRAGLALTSLRMLRGLEEVDVITIDGVRLPASVAARDEQTDLAVLRIAGPAELSAARLGDSDAVRVGDWVLAVGAPYGFEASVSAGIVSARARSRPDAPHEETLQTDAAVNPGSIGGPLVDVRGDVVGILMVPGPRGGGIGFAVTSNLARRVARDLLAHGRVIRGWLGVSTQQLTGELATALGAPGSRGVLVTDVVPGGPAARAGLARGAILLAFAGRPLEAPRELDHALDRVSPGDRIVLRVRRGERTVEMTVVVGTEPEPVPAESSAVRRLGVLIEPLTAEGGVAVAAVHREGPAAEAGMLAGDLLREVDGRVVLTVAEAERLIAGLASGRHVAFLLQRRARAFYVVVTVLD